jgi:hypothetical protein
MDLMQEMKARMDLEMHCDAILSALLRERDVLISGDIPGRDAGFTVKFSEIIADASREFVYEILVMNGSLTKVMFWQEGNPPPLRGATLNELFPEGKDEIIQDLFILLEIDYPVSTGGQSDHKHANKDLVNDFENLIGWIWILNRLAQNVLSLEIEPDGGFCTDLKKLIEDTTVLGRHSEMKKSYEHLM